MGSKQDVAKKSDEGPQKVSGPALIPGPSSPPKPQVPPTQSLSLPGGTSLNTINYVQCSEVCVPN